MFLYLQEYLLYLLQANKVTHFANSYSTEMTDDRNMGLPDFIAITVSPSSSYSWLDFMCDDFDALNREEKKRSQRLQ